MLAWYPACRLLEHLEWHLRQKAEELPPKQQARALAVVARLEGAALVLNSLGPTRVEMSRLVSILEQVGIPGKQVRILGEADSPVRRAGGAADWSPLMTYLRSRHEGAGA